MTTTVNDDRLTREEKIDLLKMFGWSLVTIASVWVWIVVMWVAFGE